jgi:hypothetical protein
MFTLALCLFVHPAVVHGHAISSSLSHRTRQFNPGILSSSLHLLLPFSDLLFFVCCSAAVAIDFTPGGNKVNEWIAVVVAFVKIVDKKEGICLRVALVRFVRMFWW